MATITRLLKTSVALIAVVCSLEKAEAQMVLSYSSSPYSYELQGQNGVVTEADGSFSVTPSFGSANAITAFIFTFPAWTMIFAGPNGVPLAVGNYPNAGNIPSTTNPWISFGAFSRHCSQTGSFDVLQIDYGPGNTITSLAVDFVVYDFGQTDDWNRGSFRYNSAIPVPEPSSILLCGLASLIFLALQKVVRNSG